MTDDRQSWMGTVLRLAAAYNLAFGLVVVGWPDLFFSLAGWEPPRYPGIWQCVGMIVGVYGIGYAIAAVDPIRHWPVVFVGWLGKILGPIGFVGAAMRGELPLSFGWMIVFNDLVWWVPFTAILWRAWCASKAAGRSETPLAPRAVS